MLCCATTTCGRTDNGPPASDHRSVEELHATSAHAVGRLGSFHLSSGREAGFSPDVRVPGCTIGCSARVQDVARAAYPERLVTRGAAGAQEGSQSALPSSELRTAQCLALDILAVHAERNESAAYQDAQKRRLDGEMALCGATHKRSYQDTGPAIVTCRNYHPDPQVCGIDRQRGGVHVLRLSEAWRLMIDAGAATGEWPIAGGDRGEELQECPDDWDAAFSMATGESVPVRHPGAPALPVGDAGWVCQERNTPQPKVTRSPQMGQRSRCVDVRWRLSHSVSCVECRHASHY